MKLSHGKLRLGYAAAFAAILLIEIVIALYVRDDFIRPYGGDILIAVLICCFVRIFFPTGVRLLPVWVFLFSAAVEIAQYFDYVTLLGLGHIEFFRVWMGTSFSFLDILCYLAGCVLFVPFDLLVHRKACPS